MKRFYLDIADLDNNIDLALKQSLIYAMAAVSVVNIHRIVIIAPNNNIAKNVGDILLALGYVHNKGVYNCIGHSTNIIINSVSKYHHFETDAVVYFALSNKEMFKIEEMQNFQLEIAIKEYGNIDLWKGTWDSFNPLTKAHIKLEPSDKVKHAFDQITDIINITHTLVFNPTDDECVKKFIRTLIALETTPVNPDEVFAYLKREKKWTLGLCELVHDWITRLNNGSVIKGGRITKTEMKKLYANW